VETAVFLGATLRNRDISGGVSKDGSELVSESWLEASFDEVTWEPIGPGASFDITDQFDLDGESPPLVILGFIMAPMPMIPYATAIAMFPPAGPPVPPYSLVTSGGGDPVLDTDQAVTVFLRLNIPADAVTSGDYGASVEVFIR
jgi:hypothetical protein